jgi:hypothetical protein
MLAVRLRSSAVPRVLVRPVTVALSLLPAVLRLPLTASAVRLSLAAVLVWALRPVVRLR